MKLIVFYRWIIDPSQNMDRAAVEQQVTNGVAVRMACLYLLMGGELQTVGESGF